MKKEQLAGLTKIAAKDIPAIATATDPLNGGRLPIGKKITFLPDMVMVPASGRIEKPWAAVVVQCGDDFYTLSPRTVLGLAFVNQKLTFVVNTGVPKGALIDFLKKAPSCKVKEYQDADVDVYGTDDKVTKSFPVFDLKAGE